MRTLLENSATTDRPSGIALVAWMFAFAALAAFTFALLLLVSAVPLSYGSILLPNGLEQSGPLPFVIYAALCGLLALGLWRGISFARRTAILVAIAGVIFLVPSISSAVVDGRILRIAREGLQIILRVAVVYYLNQEPVKDWFATKAST